MTTIKHVRQWISAGFCGGVLVTLMAGCVHSIELKPAASNSPESSAREIARHDQVPLILDSVRMTRNGAPQNLSSDTEQRVLGRLRELGLFSRLGNMASAEPAAGEKFVRAHLHFEESIDPHTGAVAWKGLLLGASMFILSPFVQLDYDYSTHVTLELERWDGQVKRYDGQSSGAAHYHLFSATPLMIEELKGQVTDASLTALMNQVVQDTPFYYASNAPLQERQIRSVSVKSKRPDPNSVSKTISIGK
jgi:hypothetical protein